MRFRYTFAAVLALAVCARAEAQDHAREWRDLNALGRGLAIEAGMAQTTFLQLGRISEIMDSTWVGTDDFRQRYGSSATAEELRFVQSLTPGQRQALEQLVTQRVLASFIGYQHPARVDSVVSALYGDTANKVVPISSLVRIAALQLAGARAEDVAVALREARAPPGPRIRLRSEYADPNAIRRDSAP